MTRVLATITTGLLRHADGRPIAYTDATHVAVFVLQQPGGSYLIDIYTRDDIPPGRLRIRLDTQPLPGAPAAAARAESRGRRRRTGIPPEAAA